MRLRTPLGDSLSRPDLLLPAGGDVDQIDRAAGSLDLRASGLADGMGADGQLLAHVTARQDLDELILLVNQAGSAQLIRSELAGVESFELTDVDGAVDAAVRRGESLQLRKTASQGHLTTFEEHVDLAASARSLGPATGRLALTG